MTLLALQPATDGIDTSIAENDSNSVIGGAYFQIVKGPVGGVRRHGLLKFDMSAIPAGSTINSATLYLYGSGGGASATIYVNRILPANSSWTEGAATWNYQDGAGGGHRWAGDAAGNGGSDAGCSVSGTDYAATSMGSLTYVLTLGVECSAALDIDQFRLMFADNYGMILRRTDASAVQAQPCSSDHATEGYRPKLVIDYTEPPAPPVPPAPLFFMYYNG